MDQVTLNTMFNQARSQNAWRSEPVADGLIEQAYEIAKWGPTSMNTQPMRLLFIKSLEGKERLKSALAPANISKVMSAPVVAIIAYDTEFYSELPKIFPHNPGAQALFSGNEKLSEATAFRNSTLQGAYFMIALRAVGLDVGPMSGFDPEKVNNEFFADTGWRVNFICGIGHGDPNAVMGRLPRLALDEVSLVI